jgi:hypothetical protein
VREDVKQVAEAIISSPKFSYFIYTITTIEIWWIDWGKPLVDASASILGVILLIVLIRKHWKTPDTVNKGN